MACKAVPLHAGGRKITSWQTNKIIPCTGATPGEKMNLLNLIRANREPSVLTGTTKEFVTGSKTNLISPTTHLTWGRLAYWIFLYGTTCDETRTHGGNWRIRSERRQWNGFTPLCVLYCDTKTVVLSVQREGKQTDSHLLSSKGAYNYIILQGTHWREKGLPGENTNSERKRLICPFVCYFYYVFLFIYFYSSVFWRVISGYLG